MLKLPHARVHVYYTFTSTSDLVKIAWVTIVTRLTGFKLNVFEVNKSIL